MIHDVMDEERDPEEIELSFAVAEQFMGWQWYHNKHDAPGDLYILGHDPTEGSDRSIHWEKADKSQLDRLVNDGLAGFAISLDYVMPVIEQIREQFSYFTLAASNGWGASCWNVDDKGVEKDYHIASHDNPAYAVCLLALAIAERRKNV